MSQDLIKHVACNESETRRLPKRGRLLFSVCNVGLQTLKTILYLHSSGGQKDPSCSSISAECVISIFLAYMPLNYVKLQVFFYFWVSALSSPNKFHAAFNWWMTYAQYCKVPVFINWFHCVILLPTRPYLHHKQWMTRKPNEQTGISGHFKSLFFVCGSVKQIMFWHRLNDLGNVQGKLIGMFYYCVAAKDENHN